VTEDGAAGRGSRLRTLSRSLVLTELATAGPLSQADLVRRTDLSRATVASIVSDLRGEGRITTRRAEVAAGRGRPPALLALAAGSRVVVGVDFGHSHLAVAIADLSGTLLAERRVPMAVHDSAPDALDRAAEMIDALLADVGSAAPPTAVVLGVPGPVDRRTGLLRSGTVLPGWEGLNPAAELAARTGLPVTAENDANLGAVGEHRFGAGRDVDDLMYVKVASGIGAGMVLGGRLYRGSRGTAGEIGHVQVREDGALCRCGSRGCLETVSSAEAALALLAPAHGHSMTVDDLIALAERGDPGTLRLLSDMGTAIGRVVAELAANLDPGLVIVGGGVATQTLVEGVSAAVHRYTQPYVSAELTVVEGALGVRAGLLGAVALAVQQAARD